MQWLRTVRNGGKLYCKPKSTTDCSAREEEVEEEVEEEEEGIFDFYYLRRFQISFCNKTEADAGLERSCTGSRVQIPFKAWMFLLVYVALYCVRTGLATS
jgi:hypothetical protein